MVTRMVGDTIVLQGELSKRTLKIMDDIAQLAPYRDQVVNQKNPDPKQVERVANMYKERNLIYIANSLLRMIGYRVEDPAGKNITDEEVIEFIRKMTIAKPSHIYKHFGVTQSKVDKILRRLLLDKVVDHRDGKYWLVNEIEGIIEQ